MDRADAGKRIMDFHSRALYCRTALESPLGADAMHLWHSLCSAVIPTPLEVPGLGGKGVDRSYRDQVDGVCTMKMDHSSGPAQAEPMHWNGSL